MYFTYAEKVGNSFIQEWRTRIVAFDSSRRYLYYSEPVPERRSPAPEPQDGENNFLFSQEDPINAVDTSISLSQVTWKQKIKVLSVEPVMTQVEFSIDDPHLRERDLYRLRIRGEARPLADLETPPVGPLLCPSAVLRPFPERLTGNNKNLIDDPFLLKEIFNALKDQYQKINDERSRIEQEASSAGKAFPVFSHQTIDSPKKPSGFWFASKKSVLLRCRDEREFRRFWYVLQIVLGYDKLIVRPYRGLPPYDPRNGISFAHIPICVWHTFKDLDKAVFYIFTRGFLLNCVDSENAPREQPSTVEEHEPSSPRGRRDALRVDIALKSAFLCITHDMVLVMRDTGNVPYWVRLQEVSEFSFNVTSVQPFVVFLTDANAPDIVFVPQPPLFGPDAIRNFDPRYEVRRIEKIMHDSCFASHTIRRVIRIREVKDNSFGAYARRMASEGRRLDTRATVGYTSTSTVSCPLPKEQLATVWNQVQAELIQRAQNTRDNRLAIPLYTDTATHIDLTPDQLTRLGQHLAAEREGRDDIVGVPLAELRQSADSAVDPSPLSTSDAAGSGSSPIVLPLTMELLHTPQLTGGRASRWQEMPSNSAVSETSGYFSTYAGYVPRSTGGSAADGSEEEGEATAANSVREGTPKPTCRRPGINNRAHSNGERHFNERHVDELMQISMDAMASQQESKKRLAGRDTFGGMAVRSTITSLFSICQTNIAETPCSDSMCASRCPASLAPAFSSRPSGHSVLTHFPCLHSIFFFFCLDRSSFTLVCLFLPMRRCFHLLPAAALCSAASRRFITPGKVKVNITTQDGTELDYESPAGISLMRSIRDVAKLDMMGLCEGKLECATCHARLSEAWAKKVPPPSQKEQDLLDQLEDFQPTSRLCCQIPLSEATDGVEVSLKDRFTQFSLSVQKINKIKKETQQQQQQKIKTKRNKTSTPVAKDGATLHSTASEIKHDPAVYWTSARTVKRIGLDLRFFSFPFPSLLMRGGAFPSLTHRLHVRSLLEEKVFQSHRASCRSIGMPAAGRALSRAGSLRYSAAHWIPSTTLFAWNRTWVAGEGAPRRTYWSPSKPLWSSGEETLKRIKIRVTRAANPEEVSFDAPPGMTLMEAIRDVGRMDMEAACDGIFPTIGFQPAPPSEDELDMLDLAPSLCATSRLACQKSSSSAFQRMAYKSQMERVRLPSATIALFCINLRSSFLFRSEPLVLYHPAAPQHSGTMSSSKCRCPTLVGVSGASGSGKTKLATTLCQELEEEIFYYHDQASKSMEERITTNYDHPNSLDHALLAEHLKLLCEGKTVELPQYDYVHHTRSAETVTMGPKHIIIVEGILLFEDQILRDMFDYRIFVDTPLDICLIRRAKRDMVERGRTFESITKQYMLTVRPMYFQFVEPSRRHADLLIPSWKENRIAMDVLKARMREHFTADSSPLKSKDTDNDNNKNNKEKSKQNDKHLKVNSFASTSFEIADLDFDWRSPNNVFYGRKEVLWPGQQCKPTHCSELPSQAASLFVASWSAAPPHNAQRLDLAPHPHPIHGKDDMPKGSPVGNKSRNGLSFFGSLRRGDAPEGPELPPSTPAYGPSRCRHDVRLYHPGVRRWLAVSVQLVLQEQDRQIAMILEIQTPNPPHGPNATRKNANKSKTASDDAGCSYRSSDSASLTRPQWGQTHWTAGINHHLDPTPLATTPRSSKALRRTVEVTSLVPRAALRPLSSTLRSEMGLTPVDSDQQTYRTARRSESPAVRSSGSKRPGSADTGIIAHLLYPQDDGSARPPRMAEEAVDMNASTDGKSPVGRRRPAVVHPLRPLFDFAIPPYPNPNAVSTPVELYDVLVACSRLPFTIEDLSYQSAEETNESGKALSRFFTLFTKKKEKAGGLHSPRGCDERSTESSSSQLRQPGTTGSLASSVPWFGSEDGGAVSPALSPGVSLGVSPGFPASRSSSGLLRSQTTATPYPQSPQAAGSATPKPLDATKRGGSRPGPEHVILRCDSHSAYLRLLRDYTQLIRDSERWREERDEEEWGRLPPALPVPARAPTSASDDDVVSPLTAASQTLTQGPRTPQAASQWMDFVRYTRNPHSRLRYAQIPPAFWNAMLDFAPQEIFFFQRSIVVVEDLSSWRGPHTLRHDCSAPSTETQKCGSRGGAPQEVLVKLASALPHTIHATEHLLSPFLSRENSKRPSGTQDVNGDDEPEFGWGDQRGSTASNEDNLVAFRNVYTCLTADSILCLNSFGTVKLQIPLTDIRVVLYPGSIPGAGAEELGPYCSFIVRDNSPDASSEHDFALTVTLLPPLPSMSCMYEAVQRPPRSGPNSAASSARSRPSCGKTVSRTSSVGPAAVTRDAHHLSHRLHAFIRAVATVIPQPGTVHIALPPAVPPRPDSNTSEPPLGLLTQRLLKTFPACAQRAADAVSLRASPLRAPIAAMSFGEYSVPWSSGGGSAGFASTTSPQEISWNMNCAKNAAERRDFLKNSCCFVPLGPRDIGGVEPSPFGFAAGSHEGGGGVIEMALSRRMAALAGSTFAAPLKRDANADFSRHPGTPLMEVLSSFSDASTESTPSPRNGRSAPRTERSLAEDGQRTLKPGSGRPSAVARTAPAPAGGDDGPGEEFVPMRPVKKKTSSIIIRPPSLGPVVSLSPVFFRGESEVQQEDISSTFSLCSLRSFFFFFYDLNFSNGHQVFKREPTDTLSPTITSPLSPHFHTADSFTFETHMDGEKTRLLGTGGAPPCLGAERRPASYNAVSESVVSLGEGTAIEEALSNVEMRRNKEKRVLLTALAFCLFFMCLEFFAGVVAHSLALLTDAIHLLTDVGSYALSFGALVVAGKSACGTFNYGWHRAEVLGTLLSVFAIYVLVGWIVVEACSRTYNIYLCSFVPAKLASTPKGSAAVLEGARQCNAIDSRVMVVVGLLGLLVNIICASILYFGGSHGHSHFGGHGHDHGHGHGHDHAHEGHSHTHGHGDEDLNLSVSGDDGHSDEDHEHPEHGGRLSGLAVNAALLHALGDCIQSLGVVLAGCFIFFVNSYLYGTHSSPYSLCNLADPLCSIFFAVVTLRMTTGLLRDLLGILMETTPNNIDYQVLETALLAIEGVVSIHDLHVWSLSSDYVALSAHLVTDDAELALRKAQEICRSRFGIDHTTFQVDNVESGNKLCPGNCSPNDTVTTGMSENEAEKKLVPRCWWLVRWWWVGFTTSVALFHIRISIIAGIFASLAGAALFCRSTKSLALEWLRCGAVPNIAPPNLLGHLNSGKETRAPLKEPRRRVGATPHTTKGWGERFSWSSLASFGCRRSDEKSPYKPLRGQLSNLTLRNGCEAARLISKFGTFTTFLHSPPAATLAGLPTDMGRKRSRETPEGSAQVSPKAGRVEEGKAAPSQSSIQCKAALLSVGTYQGLMIGLVLRGGRFYMKFSTKHHVGCINCVALSDKVVATSGTDERLFLFTNKLQGGRMSGAVQQKMREMGQSSGVRMADLGSLTPPSEIKCMSFTPSSQFLYCGSVDGQLIAYRCRDWSAVSTLPVHERCITGIAVHPQSHGALIATVGADRVVAVLDMSAQRLITKWKYLAGGPVDQRHQPEPGALVVPTVRREEPRGVAFSLSGDVLLVYSANAFQLFDTRTMKLEIQFHNSQPQPAEEFHTALLLQSPIDGAAFLLLGDESGNIRCFDLTAARRTDADENGVRSFTDLHHIPVAEVSYPQHLTAEAAAVRATPVRPDAEGRQKCPLRHISRLKALSQQGRTLFSLDARGVVVCWSLSATTTGLVLSFVASANCQGRATSMQSLWL
eukprot:gene9701-6798_t